MTDWRRYSDSNGDLVALQARTLAVWLCRHIQLLRTSERCGVKQKGRVEKCVHMGLEHHADPDTATAAWKAATFPLRQWCMELVEGVEPTTYRLQGDCAAIAPHQQIYDNYIRKYITTLTSLHSTSSLKCAINICSREAEQWVAIPRFSNGSFYPAPIGKQVN